MTRLGGAPPPLPAGHAPGEEGRALFEAIGRPVERVASSPIGLLFTISAIVFGAETLVMLFLLPAVVPDENSLPASIIDAAIMVTLSAPFLWWLIARQHHAKEVLSESEQRFRKIFQEGPLGMALVGLDYRPVKVNAALCDMLGYSADELTSLTFPEFTHPDDADADVQMAWHLLHGEISSYRMDKRYLTRTGDSIWATLTASIIRDDRGRALYYLGMVENISDRKQMEEALRAREEQTRLIIETAHDSFVGMDTEGLITAWNRQAEKTFGWSREEALGRPLSELIIPPRLQAAHREGLRRFLATGETRLLDRPLENVAIHRDGQEFPVELAVWAVGPSESCTFNAFIRDITARKLAEQNLVKLTEELETSRSTLEALNQTLEEKVRERTQKLQAREQDLILSNEELKQRNCQLLEARSQAATDALTSLPNHRAFQERIRAEVGRVAADGSSIGLIMLDIDGFKGFNDSSGHQAGDDLLRRCAQIFVETLGPDCAYRYGGDEFVVILTSADERQTADVAERLRCAVEAEVGGNGPGLTVSLGVAAFPSTAASVEELIYKADAAMYLAKSAGRNRVARWEEKSDAHSGSSRPMQASAHRR